MINCPSLLERLNEASAGSIRLITRDLESYRQLIATHCIELGLALFHWHPTLGFFKSTGKRRLQMEAIPLTHFLLQLDEIIVDAVFLIDEPGLELEAPANAQWLALLATRCRNSGSIVVVMEPSGDVEGPEVYRPQDRVAPFAGACVPMRDWFCGQRVVAMSLGAEDRAKLQASLKSRSDEDERTVFQSTRGTHEAAAVASILASRAESVDDDGLLECFRPEGVPKGLPDISGLRLESAHRVAIAAHEANEPWRVPLQWAKEREIGVMRVKMEALRDQHACDAACHKLAEVVNSLGPIILWLDGLSRAQVQDDFLDQLKQSVPEQALWMATLDLEEAKGWEDRWFEQKWAVYSPNHHERTRLIQGHFRERGIMVKPPDTEWLTDLTEGMTVRQIEALVIDSLDASLSDDRPLDETLLKELARKVETPPRDADLAKPNLEAAGWSRVDDDALEVVVC